MIGVTKIVVKKEFRSPLQLLRQQRHFREPLTCFDRVQTRNVKKQLVLTTET